MSMERGEGSDNILYKEVKTLSILQCFLERLPFHIHVASFLPFHKPNVAPLDLIFWMNNQLMFKTP